MGERLQKVIAAAGLASRRQAERWIAEGRVSVNGRTIRRPGTQVDPAQDHVKVDGKAIRPEKREYLALYKPTGVLSSVSDPQGRRTVLDLVASSGRLYPAGRLDYQSEGLVILTNDGSLTRRITRAGSVDKVYRVKVHGQPAPAQLNRLRKGFRVGDEQYAPCRIRTLKRESNSWFQVTLRQGKNRQIRRMFDTIGHPVMRLRRVAIGPVVLDGLKPGGCRRLTPSEIRRLKETSTSKPRGKKTAGRKTTRRSGS